MFKKYKQKKQQHLNKTLFESNVYNDWPVQHEFREFLEQDVHDGSLSEKEYTAQHMRDKILE